LGVVDVVVLRSSIDHRVYRRQEGEETINTDQTNATQMHDMAICYARGVLMQY
jgi:hypothetical protein